MSVRTIQLILEARDAGASTTVEGLDRRVEGLGGGLGKLRTAALAAAAGFAALETARRALTFIVDTNRETERLQAQLRTFDGSRAKAVFRDIEQFASKTPFQIEQITEAYVRLRGIGLNPTEEMMTSFGDTAAAMGKDMVQYAEAVADAATGEFERLKEFGIKASTQGEIVRLTFRGQSISVQKDAGAIVSALESIGRTQFAGGMAEQMDTMNGAISNLKDNLGTLARTLGEAGLNELIKDLVGKVRDWTGQVAANKEEITHWVRTTVEGTQFAVEAFLLIPRVATDSIQAMSAAAVFASELVKRKVNFDVGIINATLGGLEKVMPRTMAALEGVFGREPGQQLPTFEVNDLGATFEASMQGIREEAAQTIERLKAFLDTWAKMKDEINRPIAPVEGQGLGGASEGAGGPPVIAAPGATVLGSPFWRAIPKPETIKILSTPAIDAYQAMLDRMQAATEAFADSVTNSLQYGLIDVFQTLGPALLGSFGGFEGGMRAVSAAVANSLGDMMVNAGTAIVLMSEAFATFKRAISSLSPHPGIAAGLLLIAAGAAMKGAAGMIAHPGSSGGGGGAGVGGGALSLRDYGDISRTRSDQGRIEVHFPSGPTLYDANDYRQREALKRFLKALAGSREITFVEG